VARPTVDHSVSISYDRHLSCWTYEVRCVGSDRVTATVGYTRTRRGAREAVSVLVTSPTPGRGRACV
jgi:hypothetical protein